MPRGFLVKRTHRAAPVSYRVRGGSPGPFCGAPGRRAERTGRPADSSSPAAAESFPSPAWGEEPGSRCAAAGGRDGAAPRSEGRPLGGFVCQLCKEEFAGALPLAQHRCSGIARVEYRCGECGKVFSCPANLASHCRWHRPRGVGAVAAAAPKTEPPGRAGPLDCPLCAKTFRRQAYLRKHLAAHRPLLVRPPPAGPSPLEKRRVVLLQLSAAHAGM